LLPSPHLQNTYIHPIQTRDPLLAHTQRTHLKTFLADIGLRGIFGHEEGKSYPDPGTLTALMRLVQKGASRDPEGDVARVEAFRHLHVFGNRPVVGEGKEEEGGEEEGEEEEEEEGEEDEEMEE
ncbi:MAG: hypothetical protein Q9195_007265, partial [Heterodermia aff. obscurata]